MPGKIQWINHSGKEILQNDRSNLRNDDIIENVKQAVELIKGSGKKEILYLVDNSNTIIVPHVKEYIKKAGKELKPYIKKTAVIGANNAQKILLNILSTITGMNIRAFEEIESAKDWLTK